MRQKFVLNIGGEFVKLQGKSGMEFDAPDHSPQLGSPRYDCKTIFHTAAL